MKTKKPVIVIVAMALVVVSICFVSHSFGEKIDTINKNSSTPSLASSSSIVSSQDSHSRSNISAQNLSSSSASSSSSLVSSTGKRTYSISDFDFITSQLGYLCLNIYTNSDNQSYNLLFKTGNGGKIWTKVGNNKALCYTRFVNQKVGYGLLGSEMAPNYYSSYSRADNNTLVKTTDGGLTWTPINFFKDKYVATIHVVNDKILFVSTYDYVARYISYTHLYESENGGQSWKEVATPLGEYHYADFSWLTSQEGYSLYDIDNGYPTADTEKDLYVTYNGGTTWKALSKTSMVAKNEDYASRPALGDIPSKGNFGGIQFFTGGIGYISPYIDYSDDSNGIISLGILKTTDGGQKFSLVSNRYLTYTSSEDQYIQPIDFINSSQGFSVDKDFSLCYTKDGGVNWTKVTPIDYWQSIVLK